MATDFEKQNPDWRAWHAGSPCPLCGGHKDAGRSARQCFGGFWVGRPTRIRCSIVASRETSPSGRPYVPDVDAPVPYVENARRVQKPKRERRLYPETLPYRLRRDEERGIFWKQVGRWDYVFPGELFEEMPDDEQTIEGGSVVFPEPARRSD